MSGVKSSNKPKRVCHSYIHSVLSYICSVLRPELVPEAGGGEAGRGQRMPET